MKYHILKMVLRWRRRQSRNFSIEKRREEFEKATRRFKIPPDLQRKSVQIGDIEGEWLHFPAAENSPYVLLYLHGGGYTTGSVNTHRGLMSRIARATQLKVLGINYRLAPEHPFPAAVEDSIAAYRWLLKKGILPQNIAIAGDSAGGGLAIATLLSARDAGDPLPAAAVCLSPWLDMTGSGASIKSKAKEDPMLSEKALLHMAQMYTGDADPRVPLASPIYADLQGLPPFLIHVGTAEILLDDSLCFAEKARAAGVDVELEIWDAMVHVWHFFASVLPEGKRAIDKIAVFLRSKMS